MPFATQTVIMQEKLRFWVCNSKCSKKLVLRVLHFCAVLHAFRLHFEVGTIMFRDKCYTGVSYARWVQTS